MSVIPALIAQPPIAGCLGSYLLPCDLVLGLTSALIVVWRPDYSRRLLRPLKSGLGPKQSRWYQNQDLLGSGPWRTESPLGS
ncbi:hypothetical protein QYF36_005343 [Acer negundo]|nr:hypothetical protein QYF36_005343 [Acer negundo]